MDSGTPLFTQQPPFCFSVLPKTCLLGVWPSFHDAPFWNLYGKRHQVALDNNGDVVKSQLAGKRPLWSLKRQETRPRTPASLPQSHCHVSPRLGNKGLTVLTKALKTVRD